MSASQCPLCAAATAANRYTFVSCTQFVMSFSAAAAVDTRKDDNEQVKSGGQTAAE